MLNRAARWLVVSRDFSRQHTELNMPVADEHLDRGCHCLIAAALSSTPSIVKPFEQVGELPVSLGVGNGCQVARRYRHCKFVFASGVSAARNEKALEILRGGNGVLIAR